jgi:uncharacterized membrane protein
MINSEISPANSARIYSIDILRGGIMILMAVDHVRVYSGMPPSRNRNFIEAVRGN